MRFDLSSQNTKILQEQKKHRQWLIVFLGLSVTVVLGTAAALKLYGQALTHKVKVLDCRAEVHEHTEECYVYDEEKGEDVPVCGYADYLVHIHNDDCRDENGRLVCPLEEIEPHTHEDACYEERQVLICGLEGTGPVQGSHTDAAGSQPVKTPGEGDQPEQDSDAENQTTQEPVTEAPADAESELVCTNKEHTHTDACYEAELSCAQEEHQHENGCYEEALVCEAEEHQHDDSCKDEEGNLICDLEEHEHEDNCYERTLICGTEEHSHEDACYASRVLTCDIEEHQHGDACYAKAAGETSAAPETKAPETKAAETTAAPTTAGETTAAAGTTGTGTHVHTAACYETKLVPVCGKLEKHIHDEDCYDKDGKLICEVPQLEEHVHNKDCFKTVELTDEEIAALTAGAKLHIHHEECYDEDGEIICGHYETHIHGPKCYNRDDELICGHDEAHVHDSDCYDRHGELICGLEVVVHEHDEDCYDENGKLICDHAHIHEESCFDEDGNMTCDFEDVGDYLWTCEEEDYIVTVKFNHEAKIPGNAKLIAEQITAEEDEEYFARREEEYREAMNDETADMRALLRVGFYVEDKEAKKDEDKLIEIEPEAPVTVTVQFLDEDGLKEGDPITVVHFAKEGTELLDGGQAEDNSTTFEMNGFSDIAIGYGNEGAKATVSGNGIDESVSGNSVSGNSVSGNGIEGETIRLDDSFEYEDEAFHITFHVKGEVILPQNAESGEAVEGEEESVAEAESSEEGTAVAKRAVRQRIVAAVNGESNAEKVPAEMETDKNETKEGEDKKEETIADKKDESGEALKEEDSEKGAPTEDKAESTSDTQKLTLTVEKLDENSESYGTFASYTETLDNANELLLSEAWVYSLNYSGFKLDLSECEVTAEIIPVEALLDQVEANVPMAISDTMNDTEDEQTEIMITVGEVIDNVQVEEHDTIILNNDTKNSTTVVTLKGDTVIIYVTSSTNPQFSVQYYAEIDRVVLGDKVTASPLDFIDTSGGKDALPKNGETPALTKIGINEDGSVQTDKKKLTEVYKQREYEYIKAPSIKFFDALIENDSYRLKEVWIYQKHFHSERENCYDENKNLVCKYDFRNSRKEDWKIYNNVDLLHFTNREETAENNPEYILIKPGTTIRMVYEAKVDDNHPLAATFYDYDISNSAKTDENGNIIMQTAQGGINSSLNSGESGQYAFGNQNCGTNFGTNKWNGNLLNAGNTSSGGNSYKGCTFGLAQSVVAGTNILQFSDGITAPEIFGQKDSKTTVTGKKTYSGAELTFKRMGDTYTLTKASGTDAKINLSNLDRFNHPICNGTTHKIWTNNFWPLDNVPTSNRKDIMFGSYEGTRTKNNQRFEPGGRWNCLPLSDDGKDHNSFFGMYYEVEFDLSKDYSGPLEYLFYGDDDMWVFLDDTTLVCDIGGVHSSVGEYVNLWDYLKDSQDSMTADSEKHTLKFFYTERGASGSSCWMQFTLPSVTSKDRPADDKEYGELKVEKSVTVTADGKPLENYSTEEEFVFKIELTGAVDDYSYTKYGKDGTEIKSDLIPWDGDKGEKEENDTVIYNGASFTLKDGEYIIVKYLPRGTKYRITETGVVQKKEGNQITVTDSKYEYNTDITIGDEKTGADLTENRIAEGTISEDLTVKTNIVKYNNKLAVYTLPEAGGPGTILYTMTGVICLMLGVSLMYRKKYRGRRV